MTDNLNDQPTIDLRKLRDGRMLSVAIVDGWTTYYVDGAKVAAGGAGLISDQYRATARAKGVDLAAYSHYIGTIVLTPDDMTKVTALLDSDPVHKARVAEAQAEDRRILAQAIADAKWDAQRKAIHHDGEAGESPASERGDCLSLNQIDEVGA